MCADFIKEIFKTIRAYNGAAFVMTQNASDFFTMNGGEYGRAIITNADTKIIMQLPETDIEILRTAVQLTDDECNKIQQLHRGSGLVIAGSSSCSPTSQLLILRPRLSLAISKSQNTKNDDAESKNSAFAAQYEHLHVGVRRITGNLVNRAHKTTLF